MSRDALIHHLAIPKLYLEHGSIYEIPGRTWSYYPMLLDLLYMVPLAFGNDIVPKYIHFGFALFTAWLIFSYLSNRLNRNWGLVGAVFFLSIPIIVKLSITVYVDLGLVAFSTASLLMLFKWVESRKIWYLVWAGVLCGLALCTKYNALVLAFILALLVPILHGRSTAGSKHHSSLRAMGYGTIFVLCAMMTFSPMMIKNYRWTKNPIFPLYDSIFQDLHKQEAAGETSVDQSAVDGSVNIAKTIVNFRSTLYAERKILYHEPWWQAMLLPIRLFFEGQDDDPRYFDGKLNPSLLFLPFLALYCNRHSRPVKIEQYFLFAFAWLVFVYTFFIHGLRIRYLVPMLPAFVILSVYGLDNLSFRLGLSGGKSRHLSGMVTGGLVAALLMYNVLYITEQFKIYRPWSYLTGKVSRDDFIARFNPEYPVQQYANRNLRKDDKILVFYLSGRGYYFDLPVLFDEYLSSDAIFGKNVIAAESSSELAERLIAEGITHLLIRFDLFSQVARVKFSLEQIALINNFLENNCQQLAANKEYVLFKILRQKPDATQSSP